MRAFLDRRLAPLDPRVRLGLRLLLGFALYGLSLEVSDAWTQPALGLPYLSLSLGVGYALVSVWGRLLALPIAAAAFAEALAEARGWPEAAVFAAGAALSVLAMFEFASRIGSAHGERAVDTVVRSSAGLVGSTIAAAAMLAARHVGWAHYGDALVSQFAGMLVAGPCARSWLRRRPASAAGSGGEVVAMLVTTSVLAELVCSGVLGADHALAYLMFPAIVWAALRTGRRGVGAASVITAVLGAWNLAAGRGPFVHSHDPDLAFGAFVLVTSLTGLLLVGIENARHATEATLRSSEERFRAMIEHATDLVTVFSETGEILFQSPSSERILGYRPDEVVKRHGLDFIHPDDHRVMIEGAAQAIAGDESCGLIRFRHRDGHWVELDGHARDLTRSPAIGGILINARDVTAARAAERELAAAERRYRELVEELPLTVYMKQFDASQPYYASPRVEQLFGYPRSMWLDEPDVVWRLIHPDDKERVRREFECVRERQVQAEYRVRAADGRDVWVLDRMVTVCDDDGEPVGIQGFALDITERKELEEQLRQSQRLEALGLLAGGVAHDFNNLLTAISGYTELVRERVSGDARARHDLDEVLKAAHRAGDLTHQLLAFGRRQTMVTKVIDLNDVLRGTQRMLTRLLDERVEIVSLLDPELHAVRADAGQIERVLVNLAVNARDAMAGAGTLTIATRNETVDVGGAVPPGEYAVVCVADTGRGFEPAVRERLFEPFFTTKEVGKGTGLGLAVVFGIVEQSGGHIVVDSEPGIGSEFRIFLPRTDERVAAAPRRAPAPPAGSETILLVEDEDVVRRLTASMLEAQGYRVLAAASPEEALGVTEPYDLLLTDVVMPGMTGIELAERLAGDGRRPAVLFTSGYSASAVADGADLPGELLEKPFTVEELGRHVREAIDAARLVAADAA